MYGTEPRFNEILVITNTIQKRNRKIYLDITNKCQHVETLETELVTGFRGGGGGNQQKVQNCVNIGVEAWTAQALNYVSYSVAGSTVLVFLTLVKHVTYSSGLRWKYFFW